MTSQFVTAGLKPAFEEEGLLGSRSRRNAARSPSVKIFLNGKNGRNMDSISDLRANPRFHQVRPFVGRAAARSSWFDGVRAARPAGQRYRGLGTSEVGSAPGTLCRQDERIDQSHSGKRGPFRNLHQLGSFLGRWAILACFSRRGEFCPTENSLSCWRPAV